MNGTPAAVQGTAVAAPVTGPVRAWPVLLLAAPAFVAIWSGWVGLGELTGFGRVKLLPGIWDSLAVNTAITLPIGVETYAAYALRVWLTAPPGLTRRAVTFARVSAIASLVLGAAGQIAYHLMTAAHVKAAPWWIVTVVACLPVAVLGMGAALAHLVRATPAPGALPDTRPDTRPDTGADMGPVAVPDTTADMTADATAGADVRSGDRAPVRSRSVRRSVGGGSGKGRTTTAAEVARLRRRDPDMPTAQIAARLEVSDRTVRRHLADLAGAGPVPQDPTTEQTSAVPTRVMEVVR